jgi:excisionase family DNA binding protein
MRSEAMSKDKKKIPDEHKPTVQTSSDELPMKLFDPKELGLRLRVSASTIFRWRRDGLIGFFRLGNRVAFSEAHIKEFLKNHEVPPASQNSNDKAAA